MKPRVALAGASGYGRRHLDELLALHRDGLVELAAIVDLALPADLEAVTAAAGARPLVATDLARAFADAPVDIVVIATPPHTHAALAATALAAGTSVYLEKPPVPTLDQLSRLAVLAGGRRFEIGFQQTPGVVAVVAASAAALGPIRRVTGYGALQRPDAYYDRAPWAGRRVLDGAVVGDGALFNPLAHALHAALTVARVTSPRWAPSELEVELGSVRGIEADDLASVRLTGPAGPVVTAVGTTAADRVLEPGLVVVGDHGTLRVRLRDLAATFDGRDLAPGTHASTLRAAVLDPRGPAHPLLDARAATTFVQVVEASSAIPATTSLAALARHEQRDGDGWTALPGVTDALEAAMETGGMLSASGLPLETHVLSLVAAEGCLYDEEIRTWSEGASV
jgi:predicted dehydrogenase